MHIPLSDKPVTYYNLDVIISVEHKSYSCTLPVLFTKSRFGF